MMAAALAVLLQQAEKGVYWAVHSRCAAPAGLCPCAGELRRASTGPCARPTQRLAAAAPLRACARLEQAGTALFRGREGCIFSMHVIQQLSTHHLARVS